MRWHRRDSGLIMPDDEDPRFCSLLAHRMLISGGRDLGDRPAQSLTFDGGAGFTQTDGGSDPDQWSWCAWVKREETGVRHNLLYSDAGSVDRFSFETDDKLRLVINGNVEFKTTATYTATTTWIQILLVWDSATVPAADRVRLYVDGTRVTAWDTSPSISSGQNSGINSGSGNLGLGQDTGASGRLVGKMAQMIFAGDGIALSPSDVGRTSTTESGLWVPITYSGSFGASGSLLLFGDTANFGEDTSGNNNDWTGSGFVVGDQSTDVPSTV